jgi:hypothetical protein
MRTCSNHLNTWLTLLEPGTAILRVVKPDQLHDS